MPKRFTLARITSYNVCYTKLLRIDQTARFQTGHVKVMSKAYADNIDQLPNDLALLGINQIHDELNSAFSDYNWVNRINFGGIIDAPDANNESKGP